MILRNKSVEQIKADQMREANQRYFRCIKKGQRRRRNLIRGPLHVNFSPPRRWWWRQCPLAQSLLGIWIQWGAKRSIPHESHWRMCCLVDGHVDQTLRTGILSTTSLMWVGPWRTEGRNFLWFITTLFSFFLFLFLFLFLFFLRPWAISLARLGPLEGGKVPPRSDHGLVQ